MEEFFQERERREEREEMGGKTKISIYFRPEDMWIYVKFKRLAQQKGLNLTNYLRMLMIEEIKKHETD